MSDIKRLAQEVVGFSDNEYRRLLEAEDNESNVLFCIYDCFHVLDRRAIRKFMLGKPLESENPQVIEFVSFLETAPDVKAHLKKVAQILADG